MFRMVQVIVSRSMVVVLAVVLVIDGAGLHWRPAWFQMPNFSCLITLCVNQKRKKKIETQEMCAMLLRIMVLDSVCIFFFCKFCNFCSVTIRKKSNGIKRMLQPENVKSPAGI